MTAGPRLPDKVALLGVGVSVVDYEQVVGCVLAAAEQQRPLLVTACSVHTLIEAIDDPVFAAVLNTFDIVAPDGQPVRWGMAWTRQAQLAERVYGPELSLRVYRAAAERGQSVYLYGGRPRTLQLLAERLPARFPGLAIAGMRAGRFRPLTRAEQASDVDAILGSGAGIVMVGMGAPRQDWWIFHMRERIARPLLAVGAAFDFHAGLVPQAPPIMQRHGLEWLYRLAREPTRLWRRYLTITPRYLPLIASQAAGLRRFALQRDLADAAERPCPG